VQCFKPNGSVLGWEFNLRDELPVVQSWALTFDLGLIKTHQKAPNPRPKRPVMHLIKKAVLDFTDA